MTNQQSSSQLGEKEIRDINSKDADCCGSNGQAEVAGCCDTQQSKLTTRTDCCGSSVGQTSVESSVAQPKVENRNCCGEPQDASMSSDPCC